MLETAKGLVVRTRPLTETSLIIQWLTPDLGRLATVAKGALRAKSPFRGKLDLFYLADFSFSRSRRSELHTLREVSLRETHRRLRQELAYLRQASYCAALIEQTTETETPLPGVFELICGLLRHLPAQPAQAQSIFAFELKLLNELGLEPDLAQSKLTAGTRQLAQAFTGSEWPLIARLKPSGAQVTELKQFLQGFLIYHLERLPGGREAALAQGHEAGVV
jgi:DNA repair protein RecO (recombination protein O)